MCCARRLAAAKQAAQHHPDQRQCAFLLSGAMYHCHATPLFRVYLGGRKGMVYLSLTASVSTILTIYIKYNSAFLQTSWFPPLDDLASFLWRWLYSLSGIPNRQHGSYSTSLSKASVWIFWGAQPYAFCSSAHSRPRAARAELHNMPCWMQAQVCRSWPCTCAKMKGETLERCKALQAEGSNNSQAWKIMWALPFTLLLTLIFMK